MGLVDRAGPREPLVSTEDFEAAQRLLEAGSRRRTERAKLRPTTTRTYVLRSRLRCATCERRMQAAWRHGTAYYLCRYDQHESPPPEGHPPAAYVREDELLMTIDRWLAQLLDPTNLDHTVERLTSSAHEADTAAAAEAKRRRDKAARTITECERELDQYRAALREGADPAVVARWIAETQGKHLAARRELAAATAPPRGAAAVTKDELLDLIHRLGDTVTGFTTAAPADKADVYSSLGLEITYDPIARTATAACALDGCACGKGACRRSDRYSTPTAVFRTELALAE